MTTTTIIGNSHPSFIGFKVGIVLN